MELIGTVVALQVQRSRLKPLPAKLYDPAALAPVAALEVGPRGGTGITADGERVLDVHHADHPDSRNRRLANGVSLMSLDAYTALRQRYGDHLVDGIAGESLLLDGVLPVTGQVVLETGEGELRLTAVQPIPPCVGFTCFCLRRAGLDTDDEVLTTLEALGGGARGCASPVVGAGVVHVGARLWRA